MAPADSFSAPGASSYSSNTMSVGDGTWDFTKNTFLMPNLMGLNFETMRYNGMGNRFSTLTQYHSLILGHGVLAAITFLFIVPIAVLLARYYTGRPGSAIRFHAYMQILAVGLSTVIFALGFFAVGPPRNLTNPHHGIGVAIYVLILLQAVGGRLIKKLTGRRSFRVHMHRWSGRTIAILGIVQVPLGLTLYGSPKVLFILYALWMGFLLFLFFILDYRDYGRREWIMGGGGGGTTVATSSRWTSDRTDHKSGGGMKWLGALGAGAGALAFVKGRKKNRDTERGMSRSPSPSGRSRTTRDPTVISSRRESDSFYDEKSVPPRRASGGGFMSKLMGVGAGLGAGMFASRMMKGRDNRRGAESDYTAVSTETPSRVRSSRRPPPPRSEFTESEYTEFTEDTRRYPERRSSILPAPNPVAAAAALSAADERRRPRTPPRRSHTGTGTSRMDSTVDASDYSSYVSPSRRASERRKSSGAAAGKGLLAGIGLGWLASKFGGNKDEKERERLRDEEERRWEEEDRRAGRRTSKYTGDGYPSPSRRESSRRRLQRPRPPPSGVTMTETSILSTEESSIEPRGNTPYDPAPPGMRPPPPSASMHPPGAAGIYPTGGAGGPPPGGPGMPPPMATMPPSMGPAPMPPFPAGAGPSQTPPRYTPADPVAMPPMPSDPQGIFRHESDSEAYSSPGRRRRIRDPQVAEAAAQATASALAAQEENERRRRGGDNSTPSASVKLRVDDKDKGNITLRMLTDEETRREQQRRRRNDSVSSHSGSETPTGRRYRRESSSQGRAEAAAERRVELQDSVSSLPPPNAPFAGGRRPGGKDSAYYSGQQGQPGPSGVGGGQSTTAGETVSSLGTYTSGGGPDAAADRRRRRRMERRGDSASRQPTSVDYQ
ncbi:hypothetical protein QBC35DRAFT_374443 [Podospora australis]|uniref:Cytochrome b561 domain-containing protein n=1 Tax=Podospora australis TaxID=1536484 RepID=A0AAN6X1I3_9PEZI|nr:hypothetical protein QBC35DRAFT_374443 [Podospora australis]